MTKGQYCNSIGIHFYKPKFDVMAEADDKFKKDMDEFKKFILEYQKEDEDDDLLV